MYRTFDEWYSDIFYVCICNKLHDCVICREATTITYQAIDNEKYFMCEDCVEAEWEVICD